MTTMACPDKESELAHIMLVELLAHQFCFPVRWIETQDLILDNFQTQKIIEIGPSDTLTNMAKRTRDLKYHASDVARSTRRQFLSTKRNLRDICYTEPEASEPVKSIPVPQLTTTAPAASEIPIVAVVAPKKIIEIPDTPITVREIVTAIIALGLKKVAKDIPFEKSVKGLSAGKSTLQNEIIGDLEAEFGKLEESPEDAPLDQLCASLQNSFSGGLGRRSRAMIDKMIASKMTGSFNPTAIRDYLKARWGFASGRQDGILLLAIPVQPSSRLDSEEAAKRFWDGVAETYISSHNLQVTAPVIGGGENTQALTVLAAEATISRKEDPLISHHLPQHIASHAQNDKILKLEQGLAALQAEIDLWTVEHGTEYAEGIKPMFNHRKARTYDSFWNWAMQDLLILINELLVKTVKVADVEVQRRRQSLINRSTKEMLAVLKAMLSKHKDDESIQYWISELLLACEASLENKPVAHRSENTTAPQTIIRASGTIEYVETARPNSIQLDNSVFDKYKSDVTEITATPVYSDSDTASDSDSNTFSCPPTPKFQGSPTVCIQRKTYGTWSDCPILTERYMDVFSHATSQGLSFQGKNVLLTGAGRGSIGAEILRALLHGGAHVIVTTSSYSPGTTKWYQELYCECGSKGSRLVVVPFNQASQQDVEALVAYIYSLGTNEWDLDHVIPFAAIPEATRGLGDVNSKSELAHRLMLTNTLRLLGAIKREKESRKIETRPAQVILPLSPNHGAFGNDGLYAESKLGLEALFSKWHSEDWADYLSVCGAIIGWTRGTSLMADNDILSEGIEKLGITTFSQEEMAHNILSLMTSHIYEASQIEPLVADISGGMGKIDDLKYQVGKIRQEISQTSSDRRARTSEFKADEQFPSDIKESAVSRSAIARRANIKFDFPRLPEFESEVQPMDTLKDTLDLDRVVVIAGFAEVGPYGNSRTRWEMETQGQFSIEGCVEMAWMMGLIEYRSIEAKAYSGWVDKVSGEPIADINVKSKYESQIIEHSGIRLIVPRELEGTSADTKETLHEIEIQEDFPQFEVSKETAAEFKRQHGDKVRLISSEDSDQVQLVMRKGARLLIPKALNFDRTVGGQVPAGWCAKTYGIDDEIIQQVDPVVLFALVCTVEALLSAGITDPYEFYKYIHVSELGTCVGSGVGGASSLQGIFKERFLDKATAKDVLAESFINTGSAWINMLLLSSAGPNITPVGACATAIESLDVGYELIVSGKAKAVIAGGYDYLLKDLSYEFANMKATNSAEEDLENGRSPKEMSRPATSSRNGFVESEGAGIQVLTSARLALEMGLPIHGVIALTRTASDKTGMSLPAPGRGILTTTAEIQGKYDSPLLNISYRKRCIKLRLTQIQETETSELEFLDAEVASYKGTDTTFDVDQYREHRASEIMAESKRQKQETLNTYGNEFWKRDKRISPVRGALATWGLTVNDLDVASFHGTSTVKNDINESEVINTQLSQLGRTKGNPIVGVFQKYLTGHPKGAAGAWMMNGCLQIMDSGLIPGNRNADNIDSELRKYDHIVYPNRNIQKAEGVKAFSITSFGFGQKGAQAIGVHPKYLFATLDKEEYHAYSAKVNKRQKKAYKHFHKTFIGNSLFKAKKLPPYPQAQETSFLCDPSARLPMDMKL